MPSVKVKQAEYGLSDTEAAKWMRMELLVLLVLLVVEVICHVREAESHDECLLVSKRVCAAWSVVLVKDLAIVIDREVQV